MHSKTVNIARIVVMSGLLGREP